MELRIGQIVKVAPFPKAKKPAYQLWIDFGEKLGVKKSSAQVTKRYQPKELEGRKVVGHQFAAQADRRFSIGSVGARSRFGPRRSHTPRHRSRCSFGKPGLLTDGC